MQRLLAGIFYLGIALLFTHELDAMTHHEWRLLPGLAMLDEVSGRWWFVLLHVVLFAVVIGCIASLNPRLRKRSRMFTAGFMVIHAGLHTMFIHHADYTFAGFLSHGLIYGAALLGVTYLALHIWHHQSFMLD